MKKKSFRKSLVLSTALLTIVCCLIGFATVFPFGFADFPCFIEYDEQLSCIRTDSNPEILEIDENARIQVFLTVYNVRFAGGGCNYESTASDHLDMTTNVIDLEFVRRGDNLEFNGKTLETGEEFVYTKFWNPHPWTIYRIEFKNHGLTSVCGSDSPPAIYISGSYGNEISPIKAGLVLAFSIILAFVYFRFKRPNEAENENGITDTGAG